MNRILIIMMLVVATAALATARPIDPRAEGFGLYFSDFGGDNLDQEINGLYLDKNLPGRWDTRLSLGYENRVSDDDPSPDSSGFGEAVENLTEIGVAADMKRREHRIMLGLSSASDDPFAETYTINYTVAYAYRLMQKQVGTSTIRGKTYRRYSRLWLGIDYSTERIWMEGKLVPYIQYEYQGRGYYLLLGLPDTYAKFWIGGGQTLELAYTPLREVDVVWTLPLGSGLDFSVEYEFENKRYNVVDIVEAPDPDNEDLKFYSEMQWVRGRLSKRFSSKFTLQGWVGYMMGGRAYVGEEVDDDNGYRDIDSGTGVGIEAIIRL